MTDATTELRDVAEFDHPFRVTPGGTVADDVRGVYAPDVYHVDTTRGTDLEGPGMLWEPLTGYTGQYSYHGAIMHPSEFVGGRLAADILATPGVYVVVVVNVHPTIPFPHDWSPSGAQCTRTGCNIVGTGDPDDAPCLAHPDYDADRNADEFDPDPEPAGWAVLRMRHADYPHWPGRLYDCPACDAACHCAPGETECVYSGEHTSF